MYSSTPMLIFPSIYECSHATEWYAGRIRYFLKRHAGVAHDAQFTNILAGIFGFRVAWPREYGRNAPCCGTRNHIDCVVSGRADSEMVGVGASPIVACVTNQHPLWNGAFKQNKRQSMRQRPGFAVIDRRREDCVSAIVDGPSPIPAPDRVADDEFVEPFDGSLSFAHTRIIMNCWDSYKQ